MKRIWIIVIGVVLVLILGGIYMAKRTGQNQTTGTEVGYDFSTVQRMDLSQKVDATGTVVLSKNLDVYPAFEATVVRIPAKASDSIKNGDLLLVLDSPTLQTQWTEANSSYRQAEINLASAQKDLERTQILFKAQGTTIDQVEAAQSKVDIYQEQLQAAKIKIDQVQNLPDGANFIGSDHRSLLIRAPLTGSVAWINVKPGDKVTTQTVLLSLASADALAVEAKVDESEIASVRPGQKVTISSNDQDNTQLGGVVFEVGKIGTEDSGVIYFPVRIKVSDRKQVLQNGMSVDVTIVISSYPNILVVPSNAVVERRGHTMVALRQTDGINYVRVETGITSNGFTEILSGLNPGDTIAIKAVVKTNTTNNSQNNHSSSGPMQMGVFGR